MVPCKVGRFVIQEPGTGADSRTKLPELSDDELKELDEPEGPPCSCHVCGSRRDFQTGVAAVSLRSGKKRGWEKYGPGRTL
jgi:hypothetical protein